MSGYQVGRVKMSEIDNKTLRAWVNVYTQEVSNEHSDLHQEFAELVGKSRHDAKRLAHGIAVAMGLAVENLRGY